MGTTLFDLPARLAKTDQYQKFISSVLDTFKSGNIALREPTKVSFFSSLNTTSKKITFTHILRIFRRGQERHRHERQNRQFYAF